MREREEKARTIVRKYMYLSMGSGLIPIPFVDLAVVSGVQLKMLAEISHIYDVPFKDNIGKAAIGSWIGFAGPHSMACGVIPLMLKSIPVLGYLAGGPTMVLLCGAYSWALGNTFIQHFESGGTFLNFDSDKVKEYFQAQFEEGKKVAATMKTEGKVEVQA
jgi:uncharacterized protein (DUF697 family)